MLFLLLQFLFCISGGGLNAQAYKNCTHWSNFDFTSKKKVELQKFNQNFMMENENMRRQYQVIGRYPINQYTLFLSDGLGDLFQSVSIFSQSYSSLAIIQKIIDNDGRSKLRYVDATCTDSRAKRANRQKRTFCKTKTKNPNPDLFCRRP